MKQYVIGGHGHLMVGYDKAKYEPIGLDTVTIPQNVKVALFIPPGSEFSQKTGLSLQTRVLFGGGLSNDGEINSFIADIGGRIRQKKVLQKKTTFFGYDESLLTFPQLCTHADSKDLYDYTIQGPGSENDIHGFLWGVYSRGSAGPVCLIDMHGGAKSKVSTMLGAISADAGSEQALVVCVFCRVEVLDQSAKDGLAESVQSNQISLYGY